MTPARIRSQRAAVRVAATRIVRMLNEVEAGLRPARQLHPLFAAHLRAVIPQVRSPQGPVGGVRRLVISATVAGAYEIVAIRHRAGRVDAIGLRLSRTGDDWIVTDVAHPAWCTSSDDAPRGAEHAQRDDSATRSLSADNGGAVDDVGGSRPALSDPTRRWRSSYDLHR